VTIVVKKLNKQCHGEQMSIFVIPKQELERKEIFSEDIDRIVKVFSDRGHIVAREAAEWAWHDYCDDVAASWLQLPESDELLFKLCSKKLHVLWPKNE